MTQKQAFETAKTSGWRRDIFGNVYLPSRAVTAAEQQALDFLSSLGYKTITENSA